MNMGRCRLETHRFCNWYPLTHTHPHQAPFFAASNELSAAWLRYVEEVVKAVCEGVPVAEAMGLKTAPPHVHAVLTAWWASMMPQLPMPEATDFEWVSDEKKVKKRFPDHAQQLIDRRPAVMDAIRMGPDALQQQTVGSLSGYATAAHLATQWIVAMSAMCKPADTLARVCKLAAGIAGGGVWASHVKDFVEAVRKTQQEGPVLDDSWGGTAVKTLTDAAKKLLTCESQDAATSYILQTLHNDLQVCVCARGTCDPHAHARLPH